MSLKGINAYRKGNLKQDVASADPHKLTLMLLQGALDRIAYAKGAMERGEFASKSELISKVNAILLHLSDTLDMEAGGEVSQNLFALYDYMITRIGDAHVQNDLNILDEVSNLLTPIRDAWVQIQESAKAESYDKQRQNREAV